MAQKVDLYTLLKTYAQKSYSAVIETETFIKFLEKNSQRNDAVMLNIDDWRIDTRGKVIRGLNELVTQNRISIEGSGSEQKITIFSFFAEIIEKYYISVDHSLGKPLPDEKLLRIKIPENFIKAISVESGLINYLSENQNNPTQIVKIIFPESYGNALTLASHYPQKILEIAVLKVEGSLRNRSQMEFYTQKLMTHFKGQELRVRNFINVLMSRPMECIKQIEESSEFTYSFWLFLCPLIKKHVEEQIMRTNERTTDQIALIQASTLVLTMNNHYQILAINRRNSDVALGAVYEKLSEPPYIYGIGEILQFKNNFGALLTERYTQTELENYLKEKMSVSEDKKLPSLFKFKIKEGHDLFVKKECIWPLCIKMLADIQPQVKNEISQRWMKMLHDYKHEDAMEQESDFEDLLVRFCNFFNPYLLMILQDKKVAALQAELLSEQGCLPKGERFFDLEKPIPLKILMGLRKEDIIYNCKLSLPFWYSLGFIVKLVRLFRYGPQSKNSNQNTQSEKPREKTSISDALYDSAEKLAQMLVPAGDEIDEYLTTIRDRWNQLLDKTSQRKLTEDVHAIIKAHLNQVLKFQKPNTFDNQMLDENAERIIKMNSSFDRINNKNALKLYIKVYITKLLLARK